MTSIKQSINQKRTKQSQRIPMVFLDNIEFRNYMVNNSKENDPLVI